ncbi:hypothetical protein PSHT_10699 [Puccinia striiformis]|uniref:Uncharacterized protein n=1 Tax=Puccinia striiformis TaxID=27350 RepID=A0A2S4V8A9_9BASI|nr:hypothetical protein PSHT_10699 [Puccinia striiformis]
MRPNYPPCDSRLSWPINGKALARAKGRLSVRCMAMMAEIRSARLTYHLGWELFRADGHRLGTSQAAGYLTELWSCWSSWSYSCQKFDLPPNGGQIGWIAAAFGGDATANLDACVHILRTMYSGLGAATNGAYSWINKRNKSIKIHQIRWANIFRTVYNNDELP